MENFRRFPIIESVYQLGKRHAELYLNRHSGIDPTKTIAEMLETQIITDFANGRDIHKPYRLNPFKNAFRVGMINRLKDILNNEFCDRGRFLEVSDAIQILYQQIMNKNE